MFRGFIPLNTRIRYETQNDSEYGMQTTDFLYEYAHYLKEKGIKTDLGFVMNLEPFINSYFGTFVSAKRNYYFYDQHWQQTKTDQELFEAIDRNQLGDLKGKNAAMCTERSALAQQVLSLYGFESYYCIGCMEHDGKQEDHCFNVVRKKDNYMIVDYSRPVSKKDMNGNHEEYCPFFGELSKEEFEGFMNQGKIKAAREYEVDGHNKKIPLPKSRRYAVGRFDMEKEIEAQEIS